MAIWYNSDCATLNVGCYLYDGPGLTNPVANGYYSDGTNCFTVTGGSGYISSVTACTTSYDYYDAYYTDCNYCGGEENYILVAFPAGSSVIFNGSRYYLPYSGYDGFAYRITGVGSSGIAYILTTSYGSFTSCEMACSV